MAYKVHAIHKSRDTAKILLRYIVADQLNYYGEKLREIGSDVERAGPKPKYFIDDVKSISLVPVTQFLVRSAEGHSKKRKLTAKLLKKRKKQVKIHHLLNTMQK